MGFRFRRSIRIAPGLKINLSKSGPSLSLGKRGATVNFGPKGKKITIGLPGTGMSYSQRIRSGASERRAPDGDNDEPGQNQPAPISLTKAVLILAFLAFIVWLVFAGGAKPG